MSEQAILVIGTGAFVGILGALIKYGQMMHLIAGYDPERVTDKEGLANFVGLHTFAVAALTIFVGLLELWAPTAESTWYWIAYVSLTLAIAVRMIRGARQYESSPDN